MKTYVLKIFLVLLASTAVCQAQNTDLSVFPRKGNSFHFGSSVFHTMVSGNFERYKHSPNNAHHWGFGYGLSAGIGYFGGSIGGHAMVNYWSGRGKDHFEARLGVAPTFFTGTIDEDGGLFPVPIVLVGYRRQAPGSDKFFFFNVGSVGIGFGFGKALD